ncbi:MAG: HEAT repeat domain-containing protein [Planctomycetota bacterium]
MRAHHLGMAGLCLGLGSALIWSVLGSEVQRASAQPERLAPATGQAATATRAPRPFGAPAARTQTEEQGSPALDAAAAAATGRRPEEVTPAEGAKQLAGYLSCADRPAEVLALTRTIATDPQMSRLLVAEAERLRGASDPALRARGVLLLAGLGQLDARGWQAALRGELDPAARASLVQGAPYGASAAEDAALTTALVEVARHDADPAVRSAALHALPGDAPAARAGVVAVLGEDQDPEVRRTAALYLRGARASDEASVAGLLASARSATEDREVRRASAMALFRIEEATPGALAKAGASEEQVAIALESTSVDRD